MGLELGFGVARILTRVARTAMAAGVVAVGREIFQPPDHSLEPSHRILLKGRGATTVTLGAFSTGKA